MLFALITASQIILAAEPERTFWKPVRDEVYLQEVGRQVPTTDPIVTLAMHEGVLYAGSKDGLLRLNGLALEKVAGWVTAVKRLRSIGSDLWVITETGLTHYRNGEWTPVAEGKFVDVCEHLGEVFAATDRDVYRLVDGRLQEISFAGPPPPATSVHLSPIIRIASHAETLYFLCENDLLLLDGSVLNAEDVADWGERVHGKPRDILSRGERLYIATGRGLDVLRGMAFSHLSGKEGLCHEDTTCLAEGFDGDIWVGTTHGAIRMTAGEFHYFAGRRWLPDDAVHAIACEGHTVYMATNGGLGIIEYQPFTLQKKAALYEQHLENWGQKRLGFVHILLWNNKEEAWIREVSDNDAGWTCDYLAAMCFKYAVTRDETARKNAVEAFRAIKWCEEITPIDGFPARSVWAKGEPGHKAQHGSGGLPAEWHEAADTRFEWKGDTSSDETDAHFFGAAIFHDLVAEGPEKDRAKEHIARIAGHIVDNGWVLRDMDGQPTRWARWDPAYFDSAGGAYARGLNGLGILSYMRTAAAITGDPKFEEAYRRLIDMGYAEHVLRQKHTFPPNMITRFDDRLAFFLYYNLLRYETDPRLRSIYRRSLDRSWEIKRIEQTPWFNFIYGALTGNDCEILPAVKHLREWPLDLVSYSFTNKHRADLATPPGYTAYAGGTRAISPRERGPMRWSDCTLELNGGAGGRVVEDPSSFLDAYWMGRYYGFILPPDTTDEKLLDVEPDSTLRGAAPYAGPNPWS